MLQKLQKNEGELWRPLEAEPGNLAVFAQLHVRAPFISFLLLYGSYIQDGSNTFIVI